MMYARGPHLEVGAAHKARVHVDAAQAHAAALLKVKVQVLHTPARTYLPQQAVRQVTLPAISRGRSMQRAF